MVKYGVKRKESFILDDELRRCIYNYLNEEIKNLNLHVLALNILDDHVHVIMNCSNDEINEIVRKLKDYTSYKLSRQMNLSVEGKGRESKIWGKGFNRKILKNENEIVSALRYVKQNHHKHGLNDIIIK